MISISEEFCVANDGLVLLQHHGTQSWEWTSKASILFYRKAITGRDSMGFLFASCEDPGTDQGMSRGRTGSSPC